MPPKPPPPVVERKRGRSGISDPPAVLTWPAKALGACWHCCEPFPGPRFYYPVSKDVRGRYSVRGNFCSWPCTRAFVRERGDARLANLLVEMMVRNFGLSISSMGRLRPAPDRVLLQRFGGPLTPASFRTVDADMVSFDPSALLPVESPAECSIRIRVPVGSSAGGVVREEKARPMQPEPARQTAAAAHAVKGGASNPNAPSRAGQDDWVQRRMRERSRVIRLDQFLAPKGEGRNRDAPRSERGVG